MSEVESMNWYLQEAGHIVGKKGRFDFFPLNEKAFNTFIFLNLTYKRFQRKNEQ